LHLVSVAVALAAWPAVPQRAAAALATVGSVSNSIPPGGGNFAGPLVIGISDFGSLSISSGPALVVTGGSNIVVGDTADGIGVINLTGFNSNLTTTNDVVIGNAGTGSVALNSFAKVTLSDDLFLGVSAGSSGSLFVDALGTQMDIGDSAIVGQASTALVQVTAGGHVTADDTVIGQSAGGDGRIVVSGHDSLWRQTNSMTIGDAGRGDLQVLTQGRTENTNVVMGNAATAVGLALINGTGSVWETTGFMNIGVQGIATLRVFEGARATNTTTARLATAAGGEGHVEVSGLSSLWAVGGAVTVGEAGYGTVKVGSGARVTSAAVTLADNSGSRGEVLVDGVDTLWEATGAIIIGDAGEGRMTLSNSGRFATTGAVTVTALGELVLAAGRIETGAAGVTNNGLVRGSGRMVGQLANTAAGELRTETGDTLVVTGNFVNSGLANLQGGEVEVLGSATNGGDIDVANGVLRFNLGLNNNNVGQLAITAGQTDVFGAVTNAAGGQIVVGAEARAVFHDAVTQNGQFVLMPGANALLLENLSLSATSSLSFALAGDDPATDVARMEIAGPASALGTLQVSLADNFQPELGDSFQVLTAAGGLSGTFASPSLPALGAGLAWDLDYNPTSLVLNVVAGQPADFNGDGFVNSADLIAWKNGYGASSGAAKSAGDSDGDGDVDGRDFMAWQRGFGAAPPATSAGSAVPEPCGWALSAAVLAGLFSRREVFRGNR
jgi:T5SS/PEP-CTERM-associated repeat protein